MEAGYDYLLLRSRWRQRLVRGSGVTLVIIGAILFSSGVGYFVYAHKARGDLEQLNYTVTLPQSKVVDMPAISGPPAQAEESPGVPSAPPADAPPRFSETLGELAVAREEILPLPLPILPPPLGLEGRAPLDELDIPLAPFLLPTDIRPKIAPSAIGAQQLYPGEALKAAYWGDPLEYEPPSALQVSLIEGFRPVQPHNAVFMGPLPAPTRILVPSVGVDSAVRALAIQDLGDSRAYETPKHVVGHIPTSANPGEDGGVWLFGHLESPIAGEGNVFHSLPNIPDLLRKGEDVYTIVENGEGAYLYRIIETRVVHQDEMKVSDTGAATLSLVVCVPRFVYDHRLIVTGELVGFRP